MPASRFYHANNIQPTTPQPLTTSSALRQLPSWYFPPIAADTADMCSHDIECVHAIVSNDDPKRDDETPPSL